MAGSAAPPQPQVVLQEITVTATRRPENLAVVPQSIEVFNSSALESEGIRTAADLAQVAPGVDLTQTLGIATDISIRGISNTAGQITTGAATTGIYLDDTPVQVRSIGNGPGNPLPDLFDLDRVEVLRGPQGTLFGAGSEGGALRFIFNQPDLYGLSGFGRAEMGFTHDGGASYDVGAAGGEPLIDGVLAIRASAHIRHDGGYVDRDPYPDGAGPDPAEANANYTDTTSVRAALLWAPASALKITPSLYIQQIKTNDTSNYWIALSNPSEEHYVSGNGEPSPDDDRSSLGSLKLEWNLGAVELISNTSYYTRDESNLSDYRVLITNTFDSITGQSPFAAFATPGYYDNGLIINRQRQWTEEARLQSARPDSRITWVAGVFYQQARQINYQNNRTPFLDVETGIPDASEAFFGLPLLDGQYLYMEQIGTLDRQIAAYGEVNWNLTQHLQLTAGIRAERAQVDFLDTRNGPLAGGPGQDQGTDRETPKTPKYGLTYRFNQRNMVYASVSNGFRIGGVNRSISTTLCGPDLSALGLASAPETFRSDRVRQYEVGAKAQPGGRFRIAVSGYYIDWFDIIQPVDLVGCGLSFTANLGKAVSEGVDLETTFAATDNLLLNLSANYDDARFTKSIAEEDAQFDIVKSGWTLGQTPWTVDGSAEYHFGVPFGWRGYFRTDVDYRSANDGLTALTDPGSATYNPLLRPNPSTLDVKLRFGVLASIWDISLYADNATNNHPLIDLQNDSVNGLIPYALAVRPLTVGLTVETSFSAARE
jgi:outer membrane receptor protein involved in Fe transport